MFTAVAWAVPVPNTGLAKCYGLAGNVITYPSPGQVPYYQDTNHSINPPTWGDESHPKTGFKLIPFLLLII